MGINRKVTRGLSEFPVAPVFVADISCGHSFHSPVILMTQDEYEVDFAGSTADKGPFPFVKSGPTGCGEERPTPQQETLADSDTSHRRPGVGATQETATGSLVDAYFGLSAHHRTMSVSGERFLGVDDVSVLRSPRARRRARTTFK